MFQVRDNLLLVMMNHQYGVKPFDAAAVTKATIEARAEVNRIVDALRKLGGPWEGIQIAATAEQIGVRDGRRIAGRYTVGRDDLVAVARHEDAVAMGEAAGAVAAIAATTGRLPHEVSWREAEAVLDRERPRTGQ